MRSKPQLTIYQKKVRRIEFGVYLVTAAALAVGFFSYFTR